MFTIHMMRRPTRSRCHTAEVVAELHELYTSAIDGRKGTRKLIK